MKVGDSEEALSIWEDVLGEEPIQAKNYLQKFLEKNSKFCFVAEEDKAVIGVVLASFNERVGYINRIAVKKTFQNQGVASKLMKTTIEAMKNNGAPSIFIHCKSELAQLYEKFGFKIDKGSVIMRLKLD